MLMAIRRSDQFTDCSEQATHKVFLTSSVPTDILPTCYFTHFGWLSDGCKSQHQCINRICTALWRMPNLEQLMASIKVYSFTICSRCCIDNVWLHKDDKSQSETRALAVPNTAPENKSKQKPTSAPCYWTDPHKTWIYTWIQKTQLMPEQFPISPLPCYTPKYLATFRVNGFTNNSEKLLFSWG